MGSDGVVGEETERPRRYAASGGARDSSPVLDCKLEDSARLVWLRLVGENCGVVIPLVMGSIEADTPLFDVRFFPHELRSLPESFDGNDSEGITTKSRRN